MVAAVILRSILHKPAGPCTTHIIFCCYYASHGRDTTRGLVWVPVGWFFGPPDRRSGALVLARGRRFAAELRASPAAVIRTSLLSTGCCLTFVQGCALVGGGLDSGRSSRDVAGRLLWLAEAWLELEQRDTADSGQREADEEEAPRYRRGQKRRPAAAVGRPGRQRSARQSAALTAAVGSGGEDDDSDGGDGDVDALVVADDLQTDWQRLLQLPPPRSRDRGRGLRSLLPALRSSLWAEPVLAPPAGALCTLLVGQLGWRSIHAVLPMPAPSAVALAPVLGGPAPAVSGGANAVAALGMAVSSSTDGADAVGLLSHQSSGGGESGDAPGSAGGAVSMSVDHGSVRQLLALFRNYAIAKVEADLNFATAGTHQSWPRFLREIGCSGSSDSNVSGSLRCQEF